MSASGGETFNLEYVEDGFRLGVAADVLTDTQRFEKEPDLGERAIVRGRLLTGTGEDSWTGFAWDRSKGTLYLDLNRNRDLTDDPEGVFQSAGIGGIGVGFHGGQVHDIFADKIIGYADAAWEYFMQGQGFEFGFLLDPLHIFFFEIKQDRDFKFFINGFKFQVFFALLGQGHHRMVMNRN